MSLTIEEIGLLRSLVEWRRANGWTYGVAWDKPFCDRDGAPMSEPLNRHTWESPLLPNGECANVEALVIEGDLWAVNYRPDYGDEMAHIKGGSGFLALANALLSAGRESAYDHDEWRVVAVHPRSGELLMNEQRGEGAARVLLKAARTFDPDARMEHRRSGATSWVRVREAGGPDA